MLKGHQADAENGKTILNHRQEDDKGKMADFSDSAHTGFIPEEKGETDTLEVETEDETRLTWARKREYILTMMGYSIGLGSVWRFPYVCIRNGGGAFLIPYFICLILCGMPLFFLEVTLGQFLSRGALHVWCICPLFRGIGISMNVLSLVCSWFYCMILAWTLIFVAHSVRSPLPWTLCGQSWNTNSCVPTGTGRWNEAFVNGSMMSDFNNTLGSLGLNVTNMTTGYEWENTTEVTSKGTVTSTREFWIRNVLELSPGLEYMGGFPWKNVVALLVASVIIAACIIKGVQTVGKVVYVTATLPYIVLTILMIKGATLDGAVDGIVFYVKPDFSKLLVIKTWVEASIQVFYSLGPAWGGIISMASYSKFNNNCMRDSILLSFVCEGTSVFAGFAIFPVLGHMAHTLNVSVSNFSSLGSGLAFVVYPEAINYLPVPQLWSVLFFVMLFTLGLDTQFTMVETVLTTISDLWPRVISRFEVLVKMGFCVVLFLLGLPFATRGGMYLFQLADWYIACFTVALNGILECVIIAWIYGAERLLDDLQLMIGRRPPFIFAVLWRFGTPILLLMALISTLLIYEPPTFEGYTYGTGGAILGWFIAVSSFVPIPVYAAYKLIITKGTLIQRIKTCCTPTADWRPADVSLRNEYRRTSRHKTLCTFRVPCSRMA